MKKILLVATVVLALSSSAMAYDQAMAAKLNGFYSKLTQKACSNPQLFIKSEAVMAMIRDNAKFTLLDIRTKGEHDVIALNTPNELFIPTEMLFTKESLDKLPTDRPIVIVCHSGTRAGLAAAGLKVLGFNNIKVLVGGLAALAVADNPKNAPLR